MSGGKVVTGSTTEEQKSDWLSRYANRAVASILGVVDEVISDPQGRELVRRQVMDQVSLFQYRVRNQIGLPQNKDLD